MWPLAWSGVRFLKLTLAAPLENGLEKAEGAAGGRESGGCSLPGGDDVGGLDAVAEEQVERSTWCIADRLAGLGAGEKADSGMFPTG